MKRLNLLFVYCGILCNVGNNSPAMDPSSGKRSRVASLFAAPFLLDTIEEGAYYFRSLGAMRVKNRIHQLRMPQKPGR
jgi:hypothetical protein